MTSRSRVSYPAVVLTVAMALVATHRLCAQEPNATVAIHVRDAATGTAIAGAQVWLHVQDVHDVTNDRGTVVLSDLYWGRDEVIVRAFGYAPQTVQVRMRASATTSLDVAMQPLPAGLDTVQVTAPSHSIDLVRSGFYERTRRRAGTFLTAADIERLAATRTRDILRAVRGFRVSDYGIEVRRSPGCRGGVVTYIDDVMVTIPHEGKIQRAPTRVAIEEVRLEQIAGVEAYVGINIPPQYGVGEPCGVILVWLKHTVERAGG